MTPTEEQLAADKAGLYHSHEDHTTLAGEIRCTICSRLNEPPARSN